MKQLTTEIIGKYKNKSVAALLKTATKYFNMFIRFRDSEDGYGKCISSGQPLTVPSDNAHAGHFHSGGKFPRLKFNEDNVHLQGKSDNYFNGGNLLQYRKNLIRKIGEDRVEKLDLIACDKTSFKWDRFYLIEVIEEYKERVKTMKP